MKTVIFFYSLFLVACYGLEFFDLTAYNQTMNTFFNHKASDVGTTLRGTDTKSPDQVQFMDVKKEEPSAASTATSVVSNLVSFFTGTKPKESTEKVDTDLKATDSVGTVSAAAYSGPKKIVLITGISGLIGSHLAKELANNAQYQVVGLVRPNSNIDSLASVLGKVRLVVGDITDAFRILEIVEQVKPELVYHFASETADSSYNNFDTLSAVNIKGTYNVFEALRQQKLTNTKVLVASSASVYGFHTNALSGMPIAENSLLSPMTPFGVTKATTEMIATQYFRAYNIPVVIARIFTAVGIHEQTSNMMSKICKHIAMIDLGILPVGALQFKDITNEKLDVMDVRDMVPIITTLLEKGQNGASYNVGSGKAVAVQEVVTTLVKLAAKGSKSPLAADGLDMPVVPPLPANSLVHISDVSSTAQVVGDVSKRARHRLEDTLQDMLDYWRNHLVTLMREQGAVIGNAASPAGASTPAAPAPTETTVTQVATVRPVNATAAGLGDAVLSVSSKGVEAVSPTAPTPAAVPTTAVPVPVSTATITTPVAAVPTVAQGPGNANAILATAELSTSSTVVSNTAASPATIASVSSTAPVPMAQLQAVAAVPLTKVEFLDIK